MIYDLNFFALKYRTSRTAGGESEFLSDYDVSIVVSEEKKKYGAGQKEPSPVNYPYYSRELLKL
jgi:hypothetical protein